MNLAQEAIRLRVPVFPCAADKRPLVKWREEATDDPFKLSRMFRMPGAALIGMPTGKSSGIVALDIDTKNGNDGMPWVEQHLDRLPTTTIVSTRTGGLHFWFLCPRGEVTVRNSASKIAQGVDIRGDGGFVIVPPSPGWTIENDADTVPLPDWLLDVAVAPKYEPCEPVEVVLTDATTAWGRAVLRKACDRILCAPNGAQSDTLYKQAFNVGTFVGGGEIEAHEARDALINTGLRMANYSYSQPWTLSTVRSIISRGLLTGAKTPRHAPRGDLEALHSLIRGLRGAA